MHISNKPVHRIGLIYEQQAKVERIKKQSIRSVDKIS